jgi:hypothetical protein
LYSRDERRKVMGQEGLPLAIGVIVGAAVLGGLILAGLIVAAVIAL